MPVAAGDDAPVSDAELLTATETVRRAGVDAALIERLRLDGIIGTAGTDEPSPRVTSAGHS